MEENSASEKQNGKERLEQEREIAKRRVASKQQWVLTFPLRVVFQAIQKLPLWFLLQIDPN